MKEVLGFTDMNILQNNGPIAGQTVFHFHIHLIPRREGDGINVTWTPTEPTDEQIAAVQAKLTNLIYADKQKGHRKSRCPFAVHGRVWETKRFPTGIRRGGFAHSRKTVRFKVYRWNASVYSSVQTS